MAHGADHRILVAHLDELLFHVQLLLAQHAGKRRLSLFAGQLGLVQEFPAQLDGLFKAALQQAHAQHQLCVAGGSLLPPGPERDARRAVAQPRAAQGVQLAGRVARGVQLVQHIGQDIQILHFFLAQPAEVVVEIQVQAALGGVV